MKRILALILLVTSLNATTYYLRADGDDDNDGLTLTTAFATFDTAAVYVGAGDILVCDGSGGNYEMTASDTVTFTGTSSAWIKIIGVNNFTVNNATASSLNQYFYGNYLELNGLQFYGNVAQSAYMNLKVQNNIQDNPRYFRIYNCQFKQSSVQNEGVGGSEIYSGYIHLKGCTFYKSYCGPSLARFIPGDGSNWTIEYCSFSGGLRAYYTLSTYGRGFTAFNYNIVEDVTNVFDLNGAQTGTITDINDRHDYNIYYNYTTFCSDGAGADTITVQENELTTTDPLLEDPSTMNFYLQKDSPARYYAPGNATIGAKEVVSFTTKGR